jgi:LysM repeat protein
MTKRSHTLVFTLMIAATIVLSPSTARLQEKTDAVASAAQENSTYTITQGDTLWDIANTALKDPFLWPLIWKENPSIANPDLIYPGNKLTIPSLAPIERAMLAPAETAPAAVPAPVERSEKTEAAAAAPAVPAPAPSGPTTSMTEPAEPVAASTPSPTPRTVKRTPVAAEQAPEEVPSQNRLILEKELVTPLIDKYTMLSAGYVSTDQWAESITGAREPKALFGFDDVVFIKVNTPESVKIGDKYLIFAPVKKVKHPQTGKKLGNLIKVLGILQVIEKAPGATQLTARITLSFDSVSKGSMVASYQEPTVFYTVPKNDGRNIDGYIVDVMDSRSINGHFDMLYLDKGGNDGVKQGDRFMVFIDPLKKGFPKKIIGEAMVVLVKDATATAVVRNSTEAIAKGDRIELIK